MKLNLEKLSEVSAYIRQHPGCTNADVARNFGFSYKYADMFTHSLVKKNMVYTTTEKRDTHWIYKFFPREAENTQTTSTPAPVVEAKTAPESNKQKTKTLDDYNPRELMISLSKRGWKGKMSYKKEKEIDFENVTIEELQRLKEGGFVGKFTLTKVYEIEIN